MNLPTLIVLVLVAVALFLVIRFYVRSGRKITDCGCGRGSRCEGCSGCSRPQIGSKTRMTAEKTDRHPHQTV